MTGKRPLDPDDATSPGSKRLRSNNGSPAPASSSAPPNQNGGDSEIARRMAAVKARLAASKANGAAPPPPAQESAPPAANGDLEAKRADAQRKIAELKAKLAAKKVDGGGGRTASPVNGSSAAGAPPQLSEKEARIAEARARAAELSKQRDKGASPAAAASAPAPPPPRQDGRAARGGLGVGLHPSLMADSTPSSSASGKGKASHGPKFSTTRGNEAPKINPYLSTFDDDEAERQTRQDQDPTYDPNVSSKKSTGERKSKQLVFNQKGKFMAQANALRQQARLEEMKRRIAAETRKVEIEEASDKAFLVPAPPEVEWWDEGLLLPSSTSYENCLEEGHNRIATSDSIITALVQHPIQLQAPQDKLIPAPKPLMLTQQEQKKLRRQRRMADMKEEQAKIRLGLVEPPPPKVKKSNMMRVFGEQAVKDPTAVEARVNREVAQRATDHVRANEDRKLTKEQRIEKLKEQQSKDEAKGVCVAVFRVDDLSSGKHRYQVDVNAKQNALTGIVVLSPRMNLIVVEGGKHSVSSYKKLMLNRVKWGENTLPLSNDSNTTGGGTFVGSGSKDSTTSTNANMAAPGEASGGAKTATWINPLDANGELKDLSANRCVLVWEGEEQNRVFKRWGSRAVETDGEARDVLSRQRMENMWTLARSK